MSVCTVMNRNINILLKIFSPFLRIFISTCKKSEEIEGNKFDVEQFGYTRKKVKQSVFKGLMAIKAPDFEHATEIDQLSEIRCFNLSSEKSLHR